MMALGIMAIGTFSSAAAEIHDAAADGNIGKVQAILAATPSALNERDTDGRTPLHHAAAKGQLPVVELLVTRKADINARNQSGSTPMFLAKGFGQREVMAFLEKHGGKLDASQAGRGVNSPVPSRRAGPAPIQGLDDPPIFQMARRNEVEKVRALLAQDPALAKATNRWGETALNAAADARRGAVVELFIAGGAGINLKSAAGDTALHRAARANNAALVEQLLRHRPEIDATNNFGLTPLAWAASRDDERIAKLLLAQGANPNLAEWRGGVTPLWWAAQSGIPGTVKLLLEAGANVNTTNLAGRYTPLHIAARRGSPEIVALLLAHRADATARDSDGFTPLDLARQKQHHSVTDLLGGGPKPAHRTPAPDTERSLVEYYKGFDRTMRHGSTEEKRTAVLGTVPSRDDITKVFLKNADRAWQLSQERTEKMKLQMDRILSQADEDEGDIVRIELKPPGALVQSLREKRLLSPEVPVFCLDVSRTKSQSTSYEYFFVNERWVMMPAFHLVFPNSR